MDIERVNEEAYRDVMAENISHVFNMPSFNALNSSKCDQVHYLLFKDDRYRLGIILGQIGDTFLSPFSAPFGGFEAVRLHTEIQKLEQAVVALLEYICKNAGAMFKVVLPPFFYRESFLSNSLNVFFRYGFCLKTVDLGHAIDLEAWDCSRIKGQNKFSEMVFHRCLTQDEKSTAYQTIEKNRLERGYPLRMTLKDVFATTELVKADFFLVSIDQGIVVASAMVFRVADDVAQVIYWGNIKGYESYRSMNFMAFQLGIYYYRKGIKFLDIGPSTENSMPNYGLCAFKEGIGCFSYTKFALEWVNGGMGS
ncbi:MAG: hypothetical protein H6Q14_1123 [Bacteroidetes bacterium]|nr:hypothetical protein [Bacteroidota bacterium]